MQIFLGSARFIVVRFFEYSFCKLIAYYCVTNDYTNYSQKKLPPLKTNKKN